MRGCHVVASLMMLAAPVGAQTLSIARRHVAAAPAARLRARQLLPALVLQAIVRLTRCGQTRGVTLEAQAGKARELVAA
jgi:hypothetical protein